jgi:hypothetical protein
MQYYLRPDLLESAGITDFDTWAATFGETVDQIEMAPEGGSSFRQKTRFARFTNVPETLRRWHVSADIKTGEDLKLPVPALAQRPGDGQRAPETVISQPSDGQLDVMAELGDRADAIRKREVLPEEDNMLKACMDGRKAALDLRLLGRPMTVPGKIGTAAARITDLWQAHRDDIYPGPDGQDVPVRGSLQLVFCDIGTLATAGTSTTNSATSSRPAACSGKPSGSSTTRKPAATKARCSPPAAPGVLWPRTADLRAADRPVRHHLPAGPRRAGRLPGRTQARQRLLLPAAPGLPARQAVLGRSGSPPSRHQHPESSRDIAAAWKQRIMTKTGTTRAVGRTAVTAVTMRCWLRPRAATPHRAPLSVRKKCVSGRSSSWPPTKVSTFSL